MKITTKTVYRPSHVLRLVRAGKIAHTQPGDVLCEAERHMVVKNGTASPSFWANGMYIHCPKCKGMILARPEFGGFIIDLTGERKKYPVRNDRLRTEVQPTRE